MKKIIITLLAALGLVSAPACVPQTPLLHETSMNFDLKNVGPFLKRIDNKFSLGLDVNKMIAFTAATKINEENSLKVAVNFGGKPAQLQYRVFMDDVESPDIYFATDNEQLRNAIDAELLGFADDMGL